VFLYNLEWEPNYQPKEMETPGLGIKDFVEDVGHIVQNRHGRRKSRRRMTRRKKGSIATNISGSISRTSGYDGVYHQPGLNSIEDDEDDADTYGDDHYQDDAPDYSAREDNLEYRNSVTFGDLPLSRRVSSPDKRDRSMSDGTGGGFKADDEDSDDLELL
jgi:hypothetical protein